MLFVFLARLTKNCVDELNETYRTIIAEVFPWFDVKRPTAHYDPATPAEAAVRPPNQSCPWDHMYTHFRKTLLNNKNMVSRIKVVCTVILRR